MPKPDSKVVLGSAVFVPDDPTGAKANLVFSLLLDGVPQANIDITVDGGTTTDPIELIQKGQQQLKQSLNDWAAQVGS